MLLLLTNVLFLGVPVTIGLAVEALRTGDGLDDMPTIALAMAGFALATAVTRIGSRILIFDAARAAEYDLRSELFGHLLTLDATFYRQHATGDIMSRLTNDVQTVRAMWGAGVLNLINTAFAFAAVVVMMLAIDPWLTLVAILPYPTIYFVGQVMGRRIFRTSQGMQAQLGVLSNRLQEDLGGNHVIKTYDAGPARRQAFVAASEVMLDRSMALARVRGQLVPLLGALSAAGTLIVLWVGGNAVLDGRISLGAIFEFNGYVARLVWPTLALGWMLSLLQRGRASWQRLSALLATQPVIAENAGVALPVADAPAAVDVRGLTIMLGDRTILHDVSLHCPAGQVTAIVGRTGCGKSTLVDALARMIEVPPGQVFLDGHDVTQLSAGSLRAAIGYAPQEAFLFSTTIGDNIAMGYGDGYALPRDRAVELERHGVRATPPAGAAYDRDRVLAAATAAGLDRDLATMPLGLDTVVGERGITLSGGQRQRVALARALAARRRLLILDDSLSSVDAETERQILGALETELRGRTAILISHRLAAIARADHIIVLDDGRVVATGTHADLMAAGGVYAELYQRQEAPHAPEAS